MSDKTYIPDEAVPSGAASQVSQIGATLDSLFETINARRELSGEAAEKSYTNKLLSGSLDKLLKKVSEEALEVALAAKETELLLALSSDEQAIDASVDHLRYEAADVVYHLLVVLARFDISIDEFAAELNCRMSEAERPAGSIRLKDEHIRRRI